MKLTPTAAVAIATFCLLASCGPKAGGNAAAAARRPQRLEPRPARLPPAARTWRSISPTCRIPRPGSGRTRSTTGTASPPPTTSCLSGKMPTMPKMPPGCSQFSIKRTFLGHIVMDMNCATPDFTMIMHSEAQGDFQNSMSSDATMTMSTKQMAPRTTKMHSEAHYLGPCAPGQQPDDADESNATG
ncbi:MAG: DUF3617 family protein [Caulobacteraceae bacterium]